MNIGVEMNLLEAVRVAKTKDCYALIVKLRALEASASRGEKKLLQSIEAELLLNGGCECCIDNKKGVTA